MICYIYLITFLFWNVMFLYFLLAIGFQIKEKVNVVDDHRGTYVTTFLVETPQYHIYAGPMSPLMHHIKSSHHCHGNHLEINRDKLYNTYHFKRWRET